VDAVVVSVPDSFAAEGVVDSTSTLKRTAAKWRMAATMMEAPVAAVEVADEAVVVGASEVAEASVEDPVEVSEAAVAVSVAAETAVAAEVVAVAVTVEAVAARAALKMSSLFGASQKDTYKNMHVTMS